MMGRDDRPSISVGMPVYNGEPYVESALRSVLDQTFDDFELIVCDNASTDRTSEIVRDLASSDRRIRYSCNERNLGAAGNYNHAFALARAPYFRWMNADDLIEPELHALCLQALKSNPEAVLAYGHTRIIDADGAVTADYNDNLHLDDPRPSVRFRQFFERVGLANVIFGLMRRDALARTSLMGNGRMPAADIRMMAELTLLGRFIALEPTLFYRRMHAEASSWDRTDSTRQATFWGNTSSDFVIPHWRLYAGYLYRALQYRLAPLERARVISHVFHLMYWGRGKLATDLVGLVRPRQGTSS
ncbi:glycosyltransferase family 2 protein [Halofilum ochraceum]|uniref:glycosyltransferase family 2 protein n=1 Tax=Halofilum ochraceum TaxID=1611323 RepID=UPI0009F6C7D2|nr:glycosyltransferase family 2 protein [Halofilum ochraceum]